MVDALLGAAFAGVVGSDRWSAYSRFPAERRALCYAHLKRDFQALADRGGEAEPIGRWGLAEIERLFALWHVRPDGRRPHRRQTVIRAPQRSTNYGGASSPTRVGPVMPRCPYPGVRRGNPTCEALGTMSLFPPA